jgi:5-methylthioadenosine/S-adenosylhomocysteine deaminase
VLSYATAGGASNAALAHRVGSLTPGKDADIVLIRATDVNTAPPSNAVATVTAFAHPGNVDTVFIGGRPRKFAGAALVGVNVDHTGQLIEGSRNYLNTARGLTVDPFAPEGTRAAEPGKCGLTH